MRFTRLVATAVIALTGLPAVAGQTLRLVERTGYEQSVTKAGGKDSPGDLIVFRNGLYDAGNKASVGRNEGVCVRIVVGETYYCTMTLDLADGNLSIVGTLNDQGDSRLTVVAGTAKFLGTVGTLETHARDPKASSYDFTLELR